MVLVAHPLGLREDLGSVRVEHDLQQSLAVAQVDEDDAAMVTAAMGPSGDGNHLANQGLADVSAIMSAHKLEKPQGKRAMLRLGTRLGKPDPPPGAPANGSDGAVTGRARASPGRA